jgi:hypothetical protein
MTGRILPSGQALMHMPQRMQELISHISETGRDLVIRRLVFPVSDKIFTGRAAASAKPKATRKRRR